MAKADAFNRWHHRSTRVTAAITQVPLAKISLNWSNAKKVRRSTGKIDSIDVTSRLGGCYAANPCQNGGTCSNKGKGAFICQCSPRFTGSKCEKFCKLSAVSNRRFTSHRSCLSLAACYNNPCVNNGICEAFNETTYYCKCPTYFTGQRCEITVPGKQRSTEEIAFLISHRSLCELSDPCKTKNCGPFGQCKDNQGAGICFCNDGAHLDGSPCLGTVVMVVSLDLFRP